MSKTFSPLESLAISLLPEKERIAKTAFLCRKYGINVWTLAEGKEILEALGEPRGRKTVLKRVLRDEIARQTGIANRRESLRQEDRIDLDEYDPTGRGMEKSDRWRAIILSKFRAEREALTAACTEAGCSGSWMGASMHQWHLHATVKRDGMYFVIYKPWRVWNGHSYSTTHRQQWVAWTDDKHVGIVRVGSKSNASSLDSCIQSLKSSHVKKAEKRGDEIKIDWQNGQFLAKSKKRTKWREIPFKKHGRDRKAAE